MTDADFKKWFEGYRKRNPEQKVVSALTGHGLSARYAERMAAGHWPTRLQKRTKGVLTEVWEEEKAS